MLELQEVETELKKDQAHFWMRCSSDIPNEIKMHMQGSGERSRLEMISASSAMPLRVNKTMQEMLLQHDREGRK